MYRGALGFCSAKRPATLEPGVYEAFGAYRTCDISDALYGAHTMRGIRAVVPAVSRLVGPAITLSLPGSGFEMIGAAMAQAQPGDVLVITTCGAVDAAYWGGFMTATARGLGIAGLVIDGAVRDLDEIQAAGFPVFSRAVATGMAVNEGAWGQINMPIACGGISVSAGDVVVADEHGVVAIPSAWAERVLVDIGRFVADEGEGGMPTSFDLQKKMLDLGMAAFEAEPA
ncbi:RraA family protein [Mycobacterium sp. CBMA360]|nr:RraA family protein [Mycolicibacterium sp. CBMA 360]MUL62572.1 RraA family protein [Mycolicibacterium sp. CBMA 335]MUL69024.1 RraA family protein [Mycolicibacterium sp. CBMA 311]MUL96963.1 RraA family protein [Mycolicibacterium sp. CBMA 230]